MKEVSARLLQDFPGARYLFLTLTVKNCSGGAGANHRQNELWIQVTG